MLTIERLREICKRAWEGAEANGWHDRPRDDSALAMNIISEIGEMWEALRRGNPPDEHCPEFPNAVIELADVVIWCADAVGLGVPCGADELLHDGRHAGYDYRIDDPTSEVVHCFFDNVSRELRGGARCSACVNIQIEAYAFADAMGWDLDAAIDAKIEANTKRPYRHGGKVY